MSAGRGRRWSKERGWMERERERGGEEGVEERRGRVNVEGQER
jgi:hypothetical protein